MSSPLKTVVRRLRLHVRSDEIKLEIDEELQFHIEMRTQDNLNMGMAPEEARTNAQKQFGDYEKVKQDCYTVSAGGSLNKVGVRAAVPLVMTFLGLLLMWWTMSHQYNNLGGLFSVLLAVFMTFISFISVPRFFQRIPIEQSEPILGLMEKGDSVSPASFYNEAGKSRLERVLEDR